MTPINMRKIVTAALMCAIVWSCSEIEIPEQEEAQSKEGIAFSTPDNWGDTRATTDGAGKTAFEDGDKIGIFSYYFERGNQNNPEEFMLNHPVELDGDYWKYSPTKYWPTMTSDRLSFYAYHPYKEGIDDSKRVLFDLDGKKDILYSHKVNGLPGGSLLAKPDDNQVDILFWHLQNRIRFKFVLDSDFPIDRKVTKVTIDNALPHVEINPLAGNYRFYGSPMSLSIENTDGWQITETGEVTEEFFLLGDTDTQADGMSTINLSFIINDVPFTGVAEIPNNTEGNKSYLLTVNVKVEGIGISVIPEEWETPDLGIQDIDGNIKKLPESNAYIINPLRSVNQMTYRVPLDRIKTFWTQYAEVKKSDSDLESAQWQAEVIWQEQPRQVISFCNRNGEDEGLTQTGQGISSNYLYFKLKKSPGQSNDDLYGNVVVGVRRAGDENKGKYLWSWHLWITKYNPDSHTYRWDSRYIYQVPDGAIHRYNILSDGSPWGSKYKYIMDRNLGAMAAEGPIEKTIGMFYQYGRKDPFPHNLPTLEEPTNTKTHKIYTGNGVEIPAYSNVNQDGKTIKDVIVAKMAQTTFATATEGPSVYYAHADWVDWLKSNPYYKNKWNNPVTDDTAKSLFDPCPPGWLVPEKGVWGQIGFVDIYKKYTIINRGFYFPLASLEPDDEVKAFYPATGGRSASGAGFYYNNVREGKDEGIYWTSTPDVNDSKNAYRMNFYFGSVSSNEKTGEKAVARSYAFQIRCVRESDQ